MSIHVQIAELEEKKAEMLSHHSNFVDQNELIIIINRLSELRDALGKQEERVQQQEEKVQSITLPYDFNDLYGDHTANETITEVVRIFLRQTNDEHNSEVVQLHESYRGKIGAAAERETQLQRQNTILQQDLSEAEKLNELVMTQRDEYQRQLNVAIQVKKDAEQKRDNAVSELEALRVELAEAKREIDNHQTYIEDLQRQIANAPAPKAAIEIGSTSRLDDLVQQSKIAKESLADKVNRGLARWGLEPLELPALDTTELQPVQEVAQEGATFPTVEPIDNQLPDGNPATADSEVQREVTFPEEDTVQNGQREVDGNTAPSKVVGQDIKSEIEIINKRLDRLEKQANLTALEVA